jgi:orotidine-5'-phosphate decarboxylase
VSGRARLALACDYTRREDLLAALDLFEGLPVILKVGLRLMPLLKPEDYERLTSNFDLFLDAKLHDIPSQVADAAKVWESVGARYLTVHASGGPRMIREATSAVRRDRLRIAGVSVLTSFSQADLGAVGVERAVSDQVVKLVGMGIENGLRTFVCSVDELPALRGAFPDQDDLEFITPGLVLAGEKGHADQARTATVERALEEGSDVLVMGRSIFQSADPRAQAEKVLRILETA